MNFFPGTENTATTDTALATGRTTLTAFELVGQVPYSFTLEEDGVIAMLPEIRAGLVRNVAEVLDDIILNADRSTANNINADGSAITANSAGKAHWLLGYDGIPALCRWWITRSRRTTTTRRCRTICSTSCGRSWGSMARDHLSLRGLWMCIPSSGRSRWSSSGTMDKLGPNATLLTGMLGAGGGHTGHRVGADAACGRGRQGLRTALPRIRRDGCCW